MLLSASGRYWDDWAALDTSAQAVAEWNRMQGTFWQWDFLRLLSLLPGTERIGHVLTFALYLVSALLVLGLMRRLKGVSVQARVIISVLFAVFPVNAARYAHIDLMYAVALAAFLLAWWLIAIDLEEPQVWRRACAAAILLFAMLSTGSLLMFVVVLPAYVIWATGLWRDPGSCRSLFIRYGFIIGMPVVAWTIRTVALRPSGLYEGYNELSTQGLARGVTLLSTAFTSSFVDPIGLALSSHIGVKVLLGVAVYTMFLRLFPGDTKTVEHSWGRLLALTGAGMTTFAIGVYPYVAVGKIPQLLGWDSRHQLLVPIGAAMLLYALVALASRLLGLQSRATLLILCVLMGAFILADVQASASYQADWYKQVSLMQRMEQSEAMQANTHFIFTDATGDLNAAGRDYSAYEYNGMLRMVFGDATRFGVGAPYIDRYDPLVMRQYEQYNCWQYEPTTERTSVVIERGSVDVRDERVLLRLMWEEVFQPSEFRQDVADVVRIRTEPMQPVTQ